MIITHFSVTVQNNELSICLSECNIFKNKNSMNKLLHFLLHSLTDFFFSFFCATDQSETRYFVLKGRADNCRVMLGKVIILTMGISVIKRAS